MGSKERRDRERQETRERILAAAREMFAERGYDAVTMRAIANRIEYTPTAIYHHFKNKHSLLTELCRQDFAMLARHFGAAAPAGDPVERIRAVGDAYLRFAEQFPSQYRFMFMTVIPEEEMNAAMTSSGIQPTDPEQGAYAFLREACRQAIEQDRLRPEITDPDELAQILWSNVHGLVSLRMVKANNKWIPWRDLRTTARRSREVIMRGVLREPQTERQSA